jgi:hypothetical protein
MEPKTISYISIASVDMLAATNASAKSTKAAGTVKNADGLVWAQTVSCCMESIFVSSDIARDGSKESQEKIFQVLKTGMSKHLLSVMVIPEKGKDRDGKEIEVVNAKTGEPKWASWDQTRRIFAYLSDIAKVINYGKQAELYPESLKVAARCDILSLCKVPETLMNGIERLSGELQEHFDKVTERADVLKARNLCNALTVNNLEPIDEASDLIDKLDAILDSVDESERDVIRTNLNKLVKYFLAKAA